MKVALIHDFLTQYGGAERFLEAVIQFFGEATVEIYTFVYTESCFPESWRNYKIHSVSKKLPKIDFYPQLYAFYLVPLIERLDLSSFDLVFSSDLVFSKYVICPANVKHICYHHSPPSMLYPFDNSDRKESGIISIFSSFFKSFLRTHDYIAEKRIDRILTNSNTTAERVRHYYKRDAEVIYSYVDIPSDADFERIYRQSSDYFICVSRLVPQKRLDLAIKACNSLNLKLVVVGDGIDRARLEQLAGPNIVFRGHVSDEERSILLAQSRALIFPGFEDLGLTPLESMALGKPVIAYNRGGVSETVIEGKTGLFFDEQSVEALSECLLRFSEYTFDPKICRVRASEFSRDKFYTKLRSLVDEVMLKR